MYKFANFYAYLLAGVKSKTSEAKWLKLKMFVFKHVMYKNVTGMHRKIRFVIVYIAFAYK